MLAESVQIRVKMLEKRGDIETRNDLEKLLTEFYSVATNDTQIGKHFAGLNLESHLPTIADFWEKVLFGNAVYFGNPLEVHRRLNEIHALTLEDFRRWVEIFEQKVDEIFVGKTAENAKLRAKMIAHSLYQNINRKVFTTDERK